MNRVIKLLLISSVVMQLVSCGSKKNPTGGPVDTIKPEVLTTLPQQYGQLEGRIEITFSKAMDRSSFTEGLYFYPPISAKKLNYSGRTLTIQITEKLRDNTNYYLTLSTRIKDTRGNPLAQNSSLVFSNGRLNDLRLSGNIRYENLTDNGRPVSVDLFSADSILVFSHSASGSSYAIEALNPEPYLLRAYQDKDANGRYDFGKEPWFEGRANLRASSSLDLNMTYADSSRVEIQEVRTISDRELEVYFTETPASIGETNIKALGGKRLPVLIKELDNNRLSLITQVQDSLDYRLEIRDLKDSKHNHNPISGAGFRGSRKPDTIAPALISAFPRNGTSVTSLMPVLELRFSEIIPKANLKIRLLETDSKLEVPLEMLSFDSRVYRFQPQKALTNYRSHTLIISADTSDAAGNKIGKEESISFLPLRRAE